MLSSVKGYTGAAETFEGGKTLDVMRQLHPNVDHIVIVIDKTTTGDAIRKDLEPMLAPFSNDIRFEFWDDISLPQLRQRLPSLKRDTLVLLMPFARDSEGTYISFSDVAKEVSKNASVPVYGTWGFFMGHGIVGGRLTNAPAQGRAAAQLVLRVLNGEEAGNIPVTTTAPSELQFDFRQLKRFDISINDLTENSQVLYLSWSEKYKAWVIFGVGLSLLLLALIIGWVRSSQKRRYSEQTLVKSEGRFRYLFNSSPDPVWIIDHHKFVECNQAAVDMLRYPVKDLLLNTHPADLSPEFQPDGERSFDKVEQILNLAFDKGVHRFEWVQARFDKSEFWTEVTLSAIELEGREVIYCIWRDINDKKEQEEVVAVAVEEIKKANLAKDEFLASMSHELRTPLTAIIGNSEYLSEKIVVPDLKEIVRDIETAGRAQMALVNDILDMSKIDSGKFTIDEAPYNLSVLLDGVERMVSVRVQDAGLIFDVTQTNEETYQLIGDSQRISQVLINLLSNAVKFTEEGKVKLTTWVDAGHLYFEVADTGVGMSADEQGHLFKRFEQADSSTSKRFGGSGLGLYISMNLAHLMGGEVYASSQQGLGSVFTLSLQYRRSKLLVEDEGVNSARQRGVVEQFSGHVLVAEDTPALQMLERRILENMGITVTVVENGEEAVSQAMAQPFDLILMDMQMPVMDGIEATKRLKEGGNQTPVVALTANVMAKHRDKFEQAGCSGFLAKPIDKDDLREVFRQYLSKTENSKNRVLEIIEWDDSYLVGHKLLDEQHQRIAGEINELVSYCNGQKTQKSHARALGLLTKIEQAISAHLKDEEVLLKEVNYPELEPHKQMHRYYTDRQSRLFQQNITRQTIVEITGLMVVWWKNHILVEDMKFKSYFKQSGDVGFPIGYQQQEQPKLDEEVDDELIEIFKESASKYLDDLKKGLVEEDWEGVRKISHTIKGTAASFGFPHCSKLAAELQVMVDGGRIEGVDEVSTDLVQELERVLISNL